MKVRCIGSCGLSPPPRETPARLNRWTFEPLLLGSGFLLTLPAISVVLVFLFLESILSRPVASFVMGIIAVTIVFLVVFGLLRRVRPFPSLIPLPEQSP